MLDNYSMYETREPFNFTFKACLLFIDKGFFTLTDYPASKISHVIIYKLSLATE